MQPKKQRPENQTEEDYLIEAIMRINTETGKAFVFSSGKDMGVFKGVGFPEDVAEFFCLEDYTKGYFGLATAVSQRTLLAGGGEHTHSTS